MAGIRVDESREMDSASRRTFHKITQRNNYGAGSPVATGQAGWTYYDTTAKRLYLHNGTSWILQMAARIGGTWRRANNQLINNNALTAIALDTEDADSDGFLTPTSTTITVPAGLGGIYVISAEATYGVVALGANILRIAVSTITDPYEFAGTALNGFQAAVATVPLAVGSTVIVSTLHNNGVAQNVARARVDLFRIGV